MMATWNRGRHILPSVRSVLSQTMSDFELLVIGDGVTDDTEKHLASIEDPRLRWINNPERWGTQSGPHNRGINDARASIVAYCGDDDIWSQDHLNCLLEKFTKCPELGAVSSGIVVHTPDPRFPYRVLGLFEDFAPFTSGVFTPPSAFSHRVNMTPMPTWLKRHETPLHVDYAFQAELAQRGRKFGSTGRITVHKWLAVERYLSRFQPTSIAQEKMLAKFATENFEAEIDRIVQVARATNSFMAEHQTIELPEKRAANYDQIRGMELPPTVKLGTDVQLSQDSGPRGMDWHPMREDDNGYRWCGPSVNPRFLLNVVYDGRAEVRIDVAALRKRGFPDASVFLNSEPIAHELKWRSRAKGQMFGHLQLKGPLRPDRASVIEFSLPDDTFVGKGPQHRFGFAIGNVRIVPERNTSVEPEVRSRWKRIAGLRSLRKW